MSDQGYEGNVKFNILTFKDKKPSVNSTIEDYWKNKPSHHSSSLLEWMNWFDKCDSLATYQKTGIVDFSHRILDPIFYEFVGDPGQKNALEIGFGGGRLMNIACKYFKHCYGIDIHESFDKTKNILENLGNENFTLINFHQINDDIISEIAGKIDFIYSFIVFQHFSSWSVAQNYLEICDKILSPTGCGKIFFGLNVINEESYIEQGMYEGQALSLVVNPNFAAHVINEKFDIIHVGRVHKKPWQKTLSDQFYVSFKRKS